MGQRKTIDIQLPVTLASEPVYEQRQATTLDNMRVAGKIIQSRYGNRKYRTTNLGGAINGLFEYSYQGPFIIAISDDGIWFTPVAAIVGNLTISSITNPTGTTFQYNFSGSPTLSGISVNDTFEGMDCTNIANDGLFTVTAVSDADDYIRVTNASGVVQAGAAGTGKAWKAFAHPTWDGGGAAPEGTGSFSATAFWSGDILWDAVAKYPVLMVGNGLAAGAGSGGKFKIYYTGSTLHYNTAVAADGGVTIALSAIAQHTARLWSASDTVANSVDASGMDEPEDWDTAGSGIYVDSIGPGGERVTALASSRDILYVFKEKSIYKILGSDFLVPNDGEVVGPIAQIGVSDQRGIFKSKDKIFFAASSGGIWVIENDQVSCLNGVMKDDFFNLLGIVGFHEARNEMWFGSRTSGNSWVFDFDIGNWRRNTLSYPNVFLTQGGKFLCGSNNTESTTAGYVYILEDVDSNIKDYAGYFTSKMETAPIDCGDPKMEKRPLSLFVYGFTENDAAAVTVTFLYRNAVHEGFTEYVAAAGVALPATIKGAGLPAVPFTEFKVRVEATRSINLQAIQFEFIELRKKFR